MPIERVHNHWGCCWDITNDLTFADYQVSGLAIGVGFLALQQCVIMAVFMCSKKLADLCKQKLCKE